LTYETKSITSNGTSQYHTNERINKCNKEARTTVCYKEVLDYSFGVDHLSAGNIPYPKALAFSIVFSLYHP
jgi:hypothetical protein